MAKTFTDKQGSVVEFDKYEASVSVNEDIVTGRASGWCVTVGDFRYEVEEQVYNAVKNYIES